MNLTETHQPAPAVIAARAYELFQQRGGQPGRETDDWLRAEFELRHRAAQQTATLDRPRARQTASRTATKGARPKRLPTT